MNPASHPLLAKAAALYRQGRFEDCANRCQQVLQTAPRNLDALHMLAQAAFRGGAAALADAAFRQLLELAPTQAGFLVNYAKFLRAQGRLSDAETQLRQATKHAPQNWAAWHSLGLLLHDQAEYADAAACADRVLALDDRQAGGWELAAAIAQKSGDPAKGISLCREGLKRVPNAARLYYALAQCLRQECDFSAAAEAYAAAERHGFRPPELYRNRAEALLDAGELDRAVDCAVAGVKRYANHAGLQRTAARLQFSAGAAGDPIARLQQAARAQPDHTALWVTQVDLLKRMNREEDAAAALHEARALGCPSTPELEVLEAQEAARQGDHRAARERYEALLKRQPANDHVRLSFATHLLTDGDPERAEALCADILEREPHDQLALAYRGTAWQLMEDPREHWLLDYERMVVPVAVPVPDGFSDRTQFFAALGEALEGLHHTNAQPIEQSVRGGTQTNGFLFRLKHPLLRTLEEQISKAIVRASASFPDDKAHPFWGRNTIASRDGLQFAGAWSVRLSDQGYHANHIHPQGWISSALYIALPDEVQHGEGHAGHIQFGSPLMELGLDLSPRKTVKPTVGTLVLFPSYMWHGTLPFHSQQPRITVAFDLLPGPGAGD